MDREEVVRISKLHNSKGLTKEDIIALLTDYCVVEHNKSQEYTNRLIYFLLSNLGIRLVFYVEQALEYYERKFNVCKLYGKEINTSHPEQRKLLLIF